MSLIRMKYQQSSRPSLNFFVILNFIGSGEEFAEKFADQSPINSCSLDSCQFARLNHELSNLPGCRSLIASSELAATRFADPN